MTDLSALLRDTLSQPAILLICALCILLAGIAAGWIARDAACTPKADDAVDTHASADWMACAPPASAHLDLRALPTRRVRALGSDLKPSYDGRKAAQQSPSPTHKQENSHAH